MEASLRLWWRYIRKHRVAAIITAFVIVMVLIFAGYWFDWTGFNGYNKVTITHIISGTNAGTVTKTEEYQPGKGLWDWLQLLGILAIPVVVGLGTVLFTSRQTEASEANRAQQTKESEANRDKRHETDLEIAKENRKIQRETELQIAADNQQEAALQGYIDKITELMLLKVFDHQEGSIVARAQTLTVLPKLDGARKRSVLQFLQAAQLVNRVTPIINLSYADLRRANLYAVDLYEADLSYADLSYADLRFANLNGASLLEAYLIGANLKDVTGITVEELEKQAKSLKGATMPDGSKHP
jgi:Pentapeptide repeats (8 copies)